MAKQYKKLSTDSALYSRPLQPNTRLRLAVINAFWLVANDEAPVEVLLNRTAKLLRMSLNDLSTIIDSMDADLVTTMFCGRAPDWTPEDSIYTVGCLRKSKITITTE